MGDLLVLAPAREILIYARGAVLSKSPHLNSVRSAAAPESFAHCTSGGVRRDGLHLVECPRFRSRSALNFSRRLHPRYAAQCVLAEYRFVALLASRGESSEPKFLASLSSTLGPSPRVLTIRFSSGEGCVIATLSQDPEIVRDALRFNALHVSSSEISFPYERVCSQA